jgi:hypothetical protein
MGVKFPTNWDGLSEIQAVQRLLTLIILLSVSKLASLLCFGIAQDSTIIVVTKAIAAATDNTVYLPWPLDICLAINRTAQHCFGAPSPLALQQKVGSLVDKVPDSRVQHPNNSPVPLVLWYVLLSSSF